MISLASCFAFALSLGRSSSRLSAEIEIISLSSDTEGNNFSNIFSSRSSSTSLQRSDASTFFLFLEGISKCLLQWMSLVAADLQRDYKASSSLPSIYFVRHSCCCCSTRCSGLPIRPDSGSAGIFAFFGKRRVSKFNISITAGYRGDRLPRDRDRRYKRASASFTRLFRDTGF